MEAENKLSLNDNELGGVAGGNDEEVQAAVLHARRPRVVRVGAVRRVHRRAEAPLREVERRAVELVTPHEAPSVLRRA